MDDSGQMTRESLRAWIVSPAFWLCLVLAAVLYATVALAPKLLTHLLLKHEYYAHQVRLVTLERKAQYLGKVVHALEHDPDFAAELARIDFAAARPGDERIPVDPSLSLEARTEPALSTSAAKLPWYTPLVRRLATERRLRTATLAFAALLLVAAFTFLNETPCRPADGAPNNSPGPLRRFLDRYRKRNNAGLP
jgi:hypothetical protein